MSMASSSDSDDLMSAEFDPEDFQDMGTRKACETELGYVAGEDDEFDWLIDEAMESPLPEGWRMYRTSHGEVCFFNARTRRFQSVRPFAPHFAERLRVAKLKRADETVVPLSDSLSISSVHKPCDSTSESIDKEFERLDAVPKPAKQSPKRETAKVSSPKSSAKVSPVARKESPKNQRSSPREKTPGRVRAGNDDGMLEVQEQRINIEEMKRRNQQKIDELKREHRLQKARLKAEQKREIDDLINQIESVKREKLKKYSSDRDRYRAAVQKFVDDFDVDERFQIENLESNLQEAKRSYESQLGRMKYLYERELRCVRNMIQQIREQGNAEIERLKRELAERKKQELDKFEKDIFGEKKKILTERLESKKAELRICNAKIFSLKQRKGSPRRLRVSAPFALDIVDNISGHLRVSHNVEVFNKCDRDDFTLTEIPAFGSIKPRQVRFNEFTDPIGLSVNRPSEVPPRIHDAIQRMDTAFNEVGTSYTNLKAAVNDHSQSMPVDDKQEVFGKTEIEIPKPIKVFEYPRVFWTPQPVRRRETYARSHNRKSRRKLRYSSDSFDSSDSW